MAEFIFILGKNPELSMAEIVSYLRARSLEFSILDYMNDFAVLDCEPPHGMMEDLGGTIKIGEVLFSSEDAEMDSLMEGLESLDYDSLFANLPDKPVFGVSAYNSHGVQEHLSGTLKQRMKERGLKAGYIRMQEGSALKHVDVLRKGLTENGIEFLACKGKRFWLGRTVGVHNPFEFQKRDVKRPSQRAILSIPPRLCRIMINLSGAGKGDSLLDPFCGVGTILQEAVLMGLEIKGSDIEGNCVDSTRDNLAWIGKEYGISINAKESIKGVDARKLSQNYGEGVFDVIVTEPHLGPPLKRKPNQKEAQRIIKGLKTMYIASMKEMMRTLKPGGRIVIVTPCFQTERGIVRMGIEGLIKAEVADPLEGTGIKHSFPYTDSEERHKTIREISVIRKT